MLHGAAVGWSYEEIQDSCYKSPTVTSLLETSRQSCVEGRRWSGKSKHLIASHGSVTLYVLQNVFRNGSPKGF